MQKEIPADVQIDILRRLPLASCTVRFRCVSKSWLAHISDIPSFSRQQLSSPDDDDENPDSSPVTMVIGREYKHNGIDDIELTNSVYSLHSRTTLKPLLEAADLPFCSDKYRIAGCSNGLLCMHTERRYCRSTQRLATDMFLWNPATSETKSLPPTLFDARRPCTHASVLQVGFGFDPETNDYKTLRRIEYREGRNGPYTFVEVYSLRNDSWRTIDTERCPHLPFLSYCQFPQCCKEKLYWWGKQEKAATRFISFDLSREVFRTVDVANPAEKPWAVASLFVFPNQEDSLVAICSPEYDWISLEIWALLKLWVPESWTKLCTVPPVATGFGGFEGVSRNSLICYYYVENDPILVAYRLGTGERVELNMASTAGRIHQVMNYVPSRVSLT